VRWNKAHNPPREFARWCRENVPVEDHVWEDLTPEAKGALRDQLRADQSGLCAYCLVALGPETKIEHVLPQAPTTRFDWSNLALCCPGRTDEQEHCDTAKGDQPLAQIHPYLRPVLDRLRLRKDGRLTLREGEGDDTRRDVQDTLRLDIAPLRRRRESALNAWLVDIDRRADLAGRAPIRAGSLQRAVDELRRKTDPVGYGPLIEGWLLRQLDNR
jgi:uncharacterized protein (TIGR02646 family)